MSEIGIPAGIVDVEERGSGEPVLFIHPFATNAQHWRKVVPLLETKMRCILPTMPFGSHTLPMRPDADLTPPGQAKIMSDVLDALGIERATVVGNDTGGAVAQIFATQHPDRVKDLVLVSCDAYDVFPPRMFGYLTVAARIPGAMRLLAQSLKIPAVLRLPITYGWVTKEPLPADVLRSYTAALGDREILHDVVRDLKKVALGLSPRYTLAAG